MFGFLRKTQAAEKLSPAIDKDASGEPPEEHPSWMRKFVERPTNANVVALVHLYVSSRLIDLMVARGIINFGEGVTKTEEARDLAKENYAFISTVSQSHAERATDFEEFRIAIQTRVEATARKFAAILASGESRVGGKDAELAEKLPRAYKAHIAMLLNGFDTLFDIRNPAAEECGRVVAERHALGSDDFQNALVDELREAIRRGNRTKSYAFIRIAGYSFTTLGADVGGREEVVRRIAGAIDQHGALDGSLISFEDVTEDEEEEEFENLNALFLGEAVSFETHPAAFAAASEALLSWLRSSWAPVGECVAAVGGGPKLFEELKLDPVAASSMDPADTADLLLRRLKNTLAETSRPIYDPEDQAKGVAKLQPLRTEIRRFARALGGFARAKTIEPAQDDGEKPDGRGTQAFAAVASEALVEVVKTGAVTLDDRRIEHSKRRPSGYDGLIGALRGGQREVKAEFYAADGGKDEHAAAKALDDEFALAEKMLTVFSHIGYAALAHAIAERGARQPLIPDSSIPQR